MAGDFSTVQQRLKRPLLLIAGSVALIAGTTVPALVWQGEFWEIEHKLTAQANIYAERVSKIASVHPELWPYLEHRIESELESIAYASENTSTQIQDRGGLHILTRGNLPPPPRISRQAPLDDGFRQIGKITVTGSLRPALYRTAAAAAGGILLAGLILFTLWRLPLRILSRTLGELERTGQDLCASREDLSSLNEELEARIADLDRQVLTLHRTKRELSCHRAQLRTLVDTLPDLVWLKNPEGVYLDCNKKFERFFGARKTDIVGKTDFDFVDTELAAFFRERDRDAMAMGKPSSNEEWVTYADDGHRELLETIKTPMHDEQGMLIGVLGIARDITERQQAEQALRESESRLKEAQELAHLGNWNLDLTTGFGIWSEEEFRLLGYQPEEVAASAENFMNSVHPDDRKAVQAEMQRAMNPDQKVPYRIRHRVLSSDGSERIVDERGQVTFDDQGRALRMFGTTQDITERKRAEDALRRSQEMLQLVLDSIPVRVFWKDLDSVYLGCNRHFAEDAGLDKPIQIIGKNDFELNWREEAELYRSDDREVMQSGVSKLDYEEPQSQPDGTSMWLKTSKVPLRDPDGGIFGVMGVYEDISARKQAEEAIYNLNVELEQRVRERTQELESANKELESFAHAVSHDLRAPLRAIDGFSLALAEDYGTRLDETALNYLQRVRNGAQRMEMLIDDLLQFSRVSRGVLERVEVDLAAVARELLEELHSAEPDRKVEFTVDAEMRARGDPRLVRIVMSNLLSNAWKYTGREAVSCIVCERRVDIPGVFCIRDNGVGFDMSYAGKLFGVFQRLHLLSEFPGTGVGLATVQRIVHRHGGRIWAEAKEGEGAAFYFSLAPEEDSPQNGTR